MGCARDRAADATGLVPSVHCKSLPAQEVRALLTARKLVQTKHHDIEMSLRGVLRGFGLKVGATTPHLRAECATWSPIMQHCWWSPRRCWWGGRPWASN